MAESPFCQGWVQIFNRAASVLPNRIKNLLTHKVFFRVQEREREREKEREECRFDPVAIAIYWDIFQMFSVTTAFIAIASYHFAIYRLVFPFFEPYCIVFLSAFCCCEYKSDLTPICTLVRRIKHAYCLGVW